MFEVFKTPCDNCLLSKDSIVEPARVKEILNQCKEKQTFFICHVATIKGKETCCKNFFDKFGDTNRLIGMAKLWNLVQEVDMPEIHEDDKFISNRELIKSINKIK